MCIFEQRRCELKKQLNESKADVVMIEHPSNLYYYTGFTGGEGVFVFPLKEGVMSADGVVVTDSRYYEQVEKECAGLQLVKWEKNSLAQTIAALFGENPLHVLIEDTMEVSRYLKLQETCKNCRFLPGGESILVPRRVKDEGELAKIEKAEAIGDAAFTHILGILKPGITEREVALELEYFMRNQGASKLSFDTIVASGANSSMPHAQVTDRKLQKGDFVTMDFGCVYQGYCSDMTRTVAIGTPTEDMKKVYEIVLNANLRALDQIRAGKKCSEIDAVARDYIKEHGYGGYFGHGLGHGVGLDIHEEPRFSPKCDVVIRENMVITDEPGIYLPGQFGVRIEDLVVVKEYGAEKLSHSEKNLIVL